MFVVFQNLRVGFETWRHVVARFDTEQEANDFADSEDRSHPWNDMFHSVEEEK